MYVSAYVVAKYNLTWALCWSALLVTMKWFIKMSWFCKKNHLNENNEWIRSNGTQFPLNLVKLDQIEWKFQFNEIMKRHMGSNHAKGSQYDILKAVLIMISRGY